MKNTEIEHKFLVVSTSYRQLATKHYTIRQGYLCTDPMRTIRVRQKGEKAYITIKSATNPATLARFEWEREITLDDVQALFPLCLPYMIEKERFIVPWHGLTIEIDEFHGVNEGLIIAEIELADINQPLPDLPDFIGEDVSRDSRYYNSNLANQPFSEW